MSTRHPSSSKPRGVGGAKGRMLGFVEAPDYVAALAVAVIGFDIPEANRRRVIVQRTSDQT